MTIVSIDTKTKTKSKIISLPTEAQEAVELMKWIRSRENLTNYFIHIANEGMRSPRTGFMLGLQGLKRGVSDYFLARPNRSFHGLWIELKRTKRATVSQDQRNFITHMRNMGYGACISYGAEDAKQDIVDYLNDAYINVC